MEGLPEKLQALTKNRYFAYIAVIFFAFITAFVFALLANQPSQSSVEELRSEVRDLQRPGGIDGTRGSVGTSQDGQDQNIVERIINAITGRKPSQDTSPDDANGIGGPDGSQDGTNPRNIGNTNPRSGTKIPPDQSYEIIKRKIQDEALPMPRVIVDDYNLTAPLPQTPQSVKIYRLKTSYSAQEVQNLAQQLGFDSFDNDYVILEQGNNLIQVFDLQQGLYLAVNNASGSMMFIAENGITAPTGNNQNDIAETFIDNLGISNDCVRAESTYETRSEPNITNIELRCQWDSLGAPMLSSFGILNYPEGVSLANAVLGEAARAGVKTDVVTNNGNGQLRPNDFNTIIVRVDKTTGAIVGMSSNFQQIIEEEIVTADRVVGPNDAFENLQGGQKQFAFAAPSGDGDINLPSVYANNEARSQTVDVTDFMLAYTVVPGVSQNYLCPQWVTRSYGQLQTGYDATFVETVQAVSDSRCSSSNVLGETTVAQLNQPVTRPTALPNPSTGLVDPKSDENALELATFTFEGTAVDCPVADQFTNAVKYKDDPPVYLGIIDRNPPGTSRRSPSFQPREWWIFTIGEQNAASVLGSADKLSDNLRTEYLRFRAQQWPKCDVGNKADCPFPSSLAGETLVCKFLTIASPSLYIYTPEAKNVQVNLNPYGGVGYANPPMSSDAQTAGWSLFVTPQGNHHFSTGETKHRAYWEYYKYATLEKLTEYGEPDTGYVVQVSGLQEFVRSELAVTIGLNDVERKDLLNELYRETHKLDASSYVQLSVLPDAFVNEYLDMEITPQPERIYRYNLYIKPLSDNLVEKTSGTLQEPKLESLKHIVRNGYYAVETGVLLAQ